MLLVSLGLVVLAMRHFSHPDTTQQLGRWFSVAENERDGLEKFSGESAGSTDAEIGLEVSSGQQGRQDPTERVAQRGLGSAESSVPGLDRVIDRTYFRAAEREAWLNILARLQQADPQQLPAADKTKVSVVQLLEQPQVYRGRVVTVQGTVLRAEVQSPGENSLGIATYHRLWIRPAGGGPTPLVVYCLRLPSGFSGSDSRRVQVTGFFFKNWSYRWGDGLALAPTLLAAQPVHP